MGGGGLRAYPHKPFFKEFIMSETHDFYTVEEVAEMLRVHINTIRNLIKNRKLKAIKVGVQVRISKEAYEEFIKASELHS